MISSRVKNSAFVLEGINSFATSLYFNYLFFHLKADLGFGNMGNLAFSAANGLAYAMVASFGGMVGQRKGYFYALRIGFSVLALTMAVGTLTHSATGYLITLLIWTVGLSFTWPNLEALVSEGETPARLQVRIGVYNLVWASTSGLANFVGGAVLEVWGRNGTFLLPAALHISQLAILFWLGRSHRTPSSAPHGTAKGEVIAPAAAGDHAQRRPASPVPPAIFLKMAWLANPFAYMAMNAVLPVIPKLAERLNLSPMLAGFFCSVWFFSRAAAFLVLWLWPGWHYRFRWLIWSYALMILCFVAILVGNSLAVLLIAQLVFGGCVALIYYSSLFYSMDVGETKGEHGGLHEAAIGVGVFLGPAVGAASLHFFPAYPGIHTWAVSGLLVTGLGILIGLRRRYGRSSDGAASQRGQVP